MDAEDDMNGHKLGVAGEPMDERQIQIHRLRKAQARELRREKELLAEHLHHNETIQMMPPNPAS